jgi:hypothetical protein
MTTTTIYRPYKGGIQKLQPLTPDDFIMLCNEVTSLIDRVFVTDRGRYYLILN